MSHSSVDRFAADDDADPDASTGMAGAGAFGRPAAAISRSDPVAPTMDVALPSPATALESTSTIPPSAVVVVVVLLLLLFFLAPSTTSSPPPASDV